MKKSIGIFFTSLRLIYIVQSETLPRLFTSFYVYTLLPQTMNKTLKTRKDLTTSLTVTLLRRVKSWLVYIQDVKTWFFAYACKGLRKEAAT